MKTVLRATLVCALALACSLPARAQTLPSEPLSLADGRVTIGGDVSATVGGGRHGLLQLHRLRTLGPADVPGRSDGGASRRTATSPCSASCAPKMSDAPRRTRSTCGSGRGRARVRHPGRPRAADLWRVRPTHLPHRQPSHRLSARVPVPDVASRRRAADERRRTAEHARDVAGCRASRSATRRRTTASRSPAAFRWDTGVQVHAAADLVDATASVTTGTLSESALQRRQLGHAARGPPQRPSAARPGARRLGRARPVRHDHGGARRRRRRPRRRVHADGLGRRCRVFARLLSRARRNHRSASGRCRRSARRSSTRRCARWPPYVEGPLQDPAGPVRGGARRSPRLQRGDRLDGPRRRGTRRSPGSRSAAATRFSATCCSRCRASTTHATAGASRACNARRGAARLLVLMTNEHECRSTTKLHAFRIRPRRWPVVASGIAPSWLRRCGFAARAERRDPRPRRAAARRARRPSGGRPSPISARRPRCATSPIACGRSSTSRPRRAAPSSDGRTRPRRHGPARRDGSSRTCWPSRRARSSTSPTATASTTTCSRSRRPSAFDLGRYAAGRSKSVRFDRPGHRARVLRHPLAHERVHPRVQPSVLLAHRHRRPLPHRQRAARHLQPRSRGTRACRRSPSPSRCPTAARAELDFTLR